MESENFYVLLDLHPDVDDWAVIEAAILDKRRKWALQKNRGAPATRHAAERRLRRIPEMQVALRDPTRRRAIADEARKERAEVAGAALKRLGEYIDKLSQGPGTISNNDLNTLTAMVVRLDEPPTKTADLPSQVVCKTGAMASKRVYGIDLGTTCSCISYVDEFGKLVVVPNSEGSATTPSVVFFEGAQSIVVGSPAKDIALIYPDKVVTTVKRVMGDGDWVYEHAGMTLRPQDVCSFILRKLVADVEVVTGDKVTDVVLTCPASFGFNEREATRQAGALAGLNVRDIIPEPIAAAIAYGIEQTDEKVVLVYHLGGGTFDITLLAIRPTDIAVICTDGDHRLGGNNWDETIATWLAEQFAAEKGVVASALFEDLETWQDLLTMAEAAKQRLSSRSSYPARITHGGERVSVELSREKFDEITAPLLERTLSLTDELLSRARDKGYEKIDELLLVGGSTYMPQVSAALSKKYPFEVRRFDPNQAAAKGAALFGYKGFLRDRRPGFLPGTWGGLG